MTVVKNVTSAKLVFENETKLDVRLLLLFLSLKRESLVKPNKILIQRLIQFDKKIFVRPTNMSLKYLPDKGILNMYKMSKAVNSSQNISSSSTH